MDEGHIKQHHAAQQLRLRIRQIKRLLKTFRHDAAMGLISKKRGQPSHHPLDAVTQQKALDWLETQFVDFGPASPMKS